MGSKVYSLLWVMQDLCHQPYHCGTRPQKNPISKLWFSLRAAPNLLGLQVLGLL